MRERVVMDLTVTNETDRSYFSLRIPTSITSPAFLSGRYSGMDEDKPITLHATQRP